MRSGELDRLIELQSVSQGTDDDGFPTESYSTIATVWARKRFLRGDERWLGDSSQRAGEVEVEYRIRHRSDVDPTARVKDGAELWDITAPLESAQRRRFIDLVCTRFDPTDET